MRLVVELVVVDLGRLLILKALMRRSVINVFNDIFPSRFDVSVDKLFLMHVEDILVTIGDYCWDSFALKGKNGQA